MCADISLSYFYFYKKEKLCSYWIIAFYCETALDGLYFCEAERNVS